MLWDETYGDVVGLHELDLALVGLAEGLVLLGGAEVGLASGKAHGGVVVDGVHAVGKDLLESGKVHGVRVAVEVENVVGVDGADLLFHPAVPGLEVDVIGVGGLVHGVVSCYLSFLLVTVRCSGREKVSTQVFPR